MPDPIVSIIIPTFNRANYIGKAIKSVLAQSYPDWELIIWNDGSKDNSEEVIKSFQDDRIRYFFEENHGKCYALNRAIEQSKGSWIAILDDDDQWFEEKLEHQINIITKHPEVDVLFTDFTNENLVTGEKGTGFNQNSRGLRKLEVEEIEKNVLLIKDNFPDCLAASNLILPSSTIIRREVLITVGKFNERLRNSEDSELWWRIYLHDFSFAYFNRILVNRIKPAESLSSPSMARAQSVLKSIDSCRFEILKFGRQDLIPLLNRASRNAWLGILREYALLGERKMAIDSYLKSLHYGVNIQGMYLLMGAMVGPRIINGIRGKRGYFSNLRKKVIHENKTA